MSEWRSTPVSKVEKISEVWSEYTQEREAGKNVGKYWWDAGPEIHYYTNRLITGDSKIYWIPYTLEKYFKGKLPLQRCLSLGCGTGPLERDLCNRGIAKTIDAYDVAEVSIQKARELAESEGYLNINYYVSDINTIILPESAYDAVWVAGSLHHFEALEHVYQQIKKCLKPGGLLIINEYVGPSRFQFPSRQKEIINMCFQLLPSEYRIPVALPEGFEPVPSKELPIAVWRTLKWYIRRLVEKIREGDLLPTIRRKLGIQPRKLTTLFIERNEVYFPSIDDVIKADPSEAVRSSEIVEIMKKDFEILEEKGSGGNILQFLLSGIAGHFAKEDENARSLLRMIMNIEETLLASGELKSDFAYIVARPLK